MIFRIFLITFLVTVAGDIMLIPFFGGEGAAITYLLAIVVQFILFLVKTNVPGLEKNRFIFLIPIAAIAGAAAPSFLFETTWLILLVSLGFFFLLLFLMNVLGKNDWPVFKRITTI